MITVDASQMDSERQYEQVIEILKLQKSMNKELLEKVLAVVFSHVSKLPTDEEIAQSVVLMNKLFKYDRFTCESVADSAHVNEVLFEAAKIVLKKADCFPNARKSCWLSLTNKMGEYFLYELRDYNLSEVCFQRGLDMAHDFSYDRARALSNLGYLVWNRGHYVVSRRYLLEAKEIYGRFSQKKYFEQAFCLNCLGLVDKTELKYENAVKNYIEGLKLVRVGDETETHLHYTMLYHNLGTVYRLMGQYAEAEKNLKRAYHINKTTFGTDQRIEIPGNLHELGNLYFAMEQYIEAEQMYTQAFEIRKKLLPNKNHLDLAASYQSLADVYVKLDRKSEAKEYLKRKQSIYRALNVDPDTISSLSNRYCQ